MTKQTSTTAVEQQFNQNIDSNKMDMKPLMTKQTSTRAVEPEHNTESKECWCNPKMEYVKETDSWLIIHNSLDCREKKERNEKTN